jgi:hypothetical protein
MSSGKQPWMQTSNQYTAMNRNKLLFVHCLVLSLRPDVREVFDWYISNQTVMKHDLINNT